MREISGRFREYAATIPAIVPAPKSTINSSTTSVPRSHFGAAGFFLRFFRDSTQHTVDESIRIIGGEFSRKLHRFVDHDGCRRPFPAAQFKRPHLEQQT